nr:cas scaffolding protein family member 4 isoform X3 [Pogona vitticeps]
MTHEAVANMGTSILGKNTLAKALYDNKAECPDELAFRRGDILTVLEQNLLGSEGWWRCSLHGKQGMAPANRLQLLTPSLAPSTQQDSQELPNSQSIYQIPSAQQAPAPLPIYEKMDSWITSPLSASAASYPVKQEVYQVPALAAQLLSEKTQSSSNQHLYSLPRAMCASALESKNEIYDIPSPQHRESLLTQIYVIPITSSREVVTSSQGKHLSDYKTLPNLRKSEWIYDIPLSPEKKGIQETSQNHSPNKNVYDIPPTRFDSSKQRALTMKNKVKLVNPEAYDVPPIRRKLTCPEILLYDVPSVHDVSMQHQNGNYDISSAAPSCRIEKEKHQRTIYDIPRGLPVALAQKKENTHSHSSGGNTYIFPPSLSSDGNPDQDRLSVSSVDSRTSTISTLSSSSSDSFSSSASSSILSSSSEEPNKETSMELESAIETLTKLQHSVSSSIASLMIFVSSKWRYREHLEGNIDEIHRAVDHIKVSLGEFLDFAQTIEGNTASGSDSKLRTRIKKQLNILTDSFQILVETREALNNCKWSLEILVIKKPQNNPDDLDRFVMVARTIPDDIKRFVSIIIANGKLLFRKSCKEKTGKDRAVCAEHNVSLEQRVEDDSLLRSILEKPKEKARVDATEESDYIQIQKPLGLEEVQPSLSTHKAEGKNDDLKTKASPSAMKHNEESLATKMVLSSICRLYFGAVQKAIAVFFESLGSDQTPDVFIPKSKLIIMVGQRLVDALCQEAIEKSNRNEVLSGSSNFCGLLKNLAVATKNAAMQYPCAVAMKELRNQADWLLKYTEEFRAMME